MWAQRGSPREYLSGTLWALPVLSALVALLLGSALSTVDIGSRSPLYPLFFQGTPDDARRLLIAIASMILAAITLTFGLTAVALTLASTNYSPRLPRTFRRDRVNQTALSILVATFAYTLAGLYTVGVHVTTRTASYPRLAVTVAIMLTFASLVGLVFFLDHLVSRVVGSLPKSDRLRGWRVPAARRRSLSCPRPSMTR
jgi:uncharacterized membrane protein